MSADSLLPAIIIGGVVYEVVQHQGKPKPPSKPIVFTPSWGSTIGMITTGAGFNTGGGVPIVNPPPGGLHFTLEATMTQAGFNIQKPLDPTLQQKIDLLQQAAEQKFNDMSADAKAAAANTLNDQLHLDPPLNGGEDWKTICAAAGGAGGSAGASAGCSAIPGAGPALASVCGKLGAMAGAYLGVKLSDWCESEMPKLKAWVDENVWQNVKDAAQWAQDEANSAAGWVENLF